MALDKIGVQDKLDIGNVQKMRFHIKYFFGKCAQIRSFLRIRSHLLKKSLMENFIFCEVIFSCPKIVTVNFGTIKILNKWDQ